MSVYRTIGPLVSLVICTLYARCSHLMHVGCFYSYIQGKEAGLVSKFSIAFKSLQVYVGKMSITIEMMFTEYWSMA